jgi:hypothetical protein
MTEQQNGFEYDGIFYPWHVTTTGKDLLLIDRISGMGIQEFFEMIEDNYDLSRAPVTLSLIATSIRNRHPEWSLERIVRTVMGIDIESDDFTVIGGEEAADDSPPAEAATSGQSGTPSATSNGSAEATSKVSPATPPSSGSPGSPTGSPGSPVTA